MPAAVTGQDKAAYAAWLRAEREHRGWTRPDMARRLIGAAHIQGDNTVPGPDSMTHNVYRWERGAERPGEYYRLLIRAVLGQPPPPVNGNGHQPPPPATASGAGPPSVLTFTITIQLPPGATTAITSSTS
jgi:hypothetical protein